MEMAGNPRACRTPEVESKIEALRLILDPEGALALLRQLEKFMQFRGGGVAQERNVTVGYNEKVAGGIGKEIQDYEEIPAARDYVVVLIPIFGQNPAKNAAVVAFPDVIDVIETPGRPEVIHSQYN